MNLFLKNYNLAEVTFFHTICNQEFRFFIIFGESSRIEIYGKTGLQIYSSVFLAKLKSELGL